MTSAAEKHICRVFLYREYLLIFTLKKKSHQAAECCKTRKFTMPVLFHKAPAGTWSRPVAACPHSTNNTHWLKKSLIIHQLNKHQEAWWVKAPCQGVVILSITEWLVVASKYLQRNEEDEPGCVANTTSNKHKGATGSLDRRTLPRQGSREVCLT